MRGFPYNQTSAPATELSAEKLRNAIRARRLFVCSTACLHTDTPIEASPTTTAEKNPDRTVSLFRFCDCGHAKGQCGLPHIAILPCESSIHRIYSAVIGVDGRVLSRPHTEMDKRDIASAFRLLRVRPALSLLMCTELPGCALGRPLDLILFYLAMPFGWNGAPANFFHFWRCDIEHAFPILNGASRLDPSSVLSAQLVRR